MVMGRNSHMTYIVDKYGLDTRLRSSKMQMMVREAHSPSAADSSWVLLSF